MPTDSISNITISEIVIILCLLFRGLLVMFDLINTFFIKFTPFSLLIQK